MRDAICFLTVLPLRRAAGPPAPDCVRWFPVVGLVVGVTWALTYAAVSHLLGPLAAAASVLCVDAALTGALHLDAVADVADGVASRRPPPEAVEIMREPGVGAVGAAVLIVVCLLRLSLIAPVGSHAVTLITAPVAGRAAMALLLLLVSARQDTSLAAAFHPMSLRPPIQAMILATVLVLLLGLWAQSLAPLSGLAVALISTPLYGAWWRARFGPLTGDGAGADGILAETLALLVLGVTLNSL